MVLTGVQSKKFCNINTKGEELRDSRFTMIFAFFFDASKVFLFFSSQKRTLRKRKYALNLLRVNHLQAFALLSTLSEQFAIIIYHDFVFFFFSTSCVRF